MTEPPVPDDESTYRLASTTKAGTAIDEGRGRTFPCEECGADLLFSIGQQSLECPFCGSVQAIEIDESAQIVEQDLVAMINRIRRQRRERDEAEQPKKDGATAAKEVQCDGCGATTVFVGALSTGECPYCATPIQLEGVHDAEDRVPVDGVLPFLVDRDVAKANLKKWVKSLWFAPSALQRRGVDGTFNGVYLPYWTFDAMTFNQYSGQRGENYTVTVGTGKNRRTETRTRWYPASGRFQRFFDDVLVLASPGMNRSLMQKLEPWPLQKCIPFTQQVLAGYVARTYEIDLEPGFKEARDRIREALEADVRRRIGGDKQRVHDIDTRYDAATFKHLLLPVWLLAYNFKGKTYQVMVNAGTGEVQGERPWSVVKILLTVLAVAAVVGAIVFVASR